MNKILLSDVAISQTGPFGSQLHEEDYVEVGTPIVTVEHLGEIGFTRQNLPFVSSSDRERLSKYLLKEGDIVFSRVGSVDRNTYVSSREEGWLFSGRCIRVRVDKTKINSKFLNFYFRQKNFKSMMRDIAVGATMPSLNTGLMNTLPLSVPSRSTQDKIAATLSALDDKIEHNRKINTELEQVARTLYDYWFVQFDFPNSEGKPYKTSGGQMTYSPELKREIPTVWKTQNMLKNDLFSVIKPKIDYFDSTKQYIATADVNDLSISDGSPINYDSRESRANMQPMDHTIWFAKMKDSIKHILVGDYTKDLIAGAIFSTGFMGLQADKTSFEYVALTVHRPYFELVKNANSNGATMAAIGNNDMKNIKFLVPEASVIVDFHKKIRHILEKIDLNRQESQKLAQLRDWLLPMLMNGQVKVS